jgi:crossover junction endodeoxyribonuclease RusA
MIEVFVAGIPAAQGSKRFIGIKGGRGVLIESSKAVKPWRESIRSSLVAADGRPVERIEGAVVSTLEFILPRPKSTPKKREPFAVKKPDLDKLERAVNDAVKSAGCIVDDSYIVRTVKTKRLARIGEVPGLWIRLTAAEATAEVPVSRSLNGGIDGTDDDRETHPA